jgi:transcriptional regulator of acetoin/glycerol metabolism
VPRRLEVVAGGTDDDRMLLQHALEAHRWNRLETARALGVSRSTLWRRMRTAGLE